MESTRVESRKEKTMISELIHGMELAKQLKIQLGIASSSVESKEIDLAQQIVSSYEKALSVLKWNGPTVQQSQLPRVSSGTPECPALIGPSPRRDDIDEAISINDHHDYNIGSKKRKTLPRWTEKVRVSTERRLEGPQDDGYSWRKYGQKEILGAKYPRSYYRCIYKNAQDCWATKQVQRSDDDPTVFEVTYRGRHTCSQVIPSPATPEKQETSPSGNYQNDLLENLRNDPTDMAPNAYCFPATFCHVGYFEPSEIDRMVSTSGSPILDVDFSINPTVEIDTNFGFDGAMFFP